MKLRPIFSKKFGHWVLCHDQPCNKGETSAVARLYTDEATARWICDRFSTHPKPQMFLSHMQEVFEL